MSNYSTRQTIAYEIGLTKQALLHHFGSKEKLYGAVLARISNQFEALRTNDAGLSIDPAARLKSVFMELLRTSIQRTSHTSILMRELLDNKRRADTAGTGYLA